MTSHTSPAPAALALWKKLAFAGVTTLGFLAVLEGVARVFVAPLPPLADPYVGFSSRIPLYVEDEGADGSVDLVTAENRVAFFHSQRFARDKPADAVRIFTLGGSSAYGRPYEADVVSPAGWMRKFFQIVEDGSRYEVINAGGISYASYRVALVMEELVHYEPDIFVVYTGHNEFLERRSYPRAVEVPRAINELGALASRTRLYAAAHRVLQGSRSGGGGGGGGGGSDEAPSENVLGPEVEAMLDRSVGPSDYRRDDEWTDQVIAHYRFNLHRIDEIARDAGARLVFVTPPSNLGACAPFKSHWELPREQRTEARATMRRARELADSGDLADWQRVYDLVEPLTRLDPRHGHAQFLLGRALRGLGRNDEAHAAFVRARDEDICPLRAPTRMLEAMRAVAAARAIPLVDFAAIARRDAPDGIPGEDAFLDHVHLDARGYGRVARAVIEEMASRGWVTLGDAWSEATLAQAEREQLALIDRKAEAKAMRNLAKVYSWAGKWDDAKRAALRAIELDPEEPSAYHVLGVMHSMNGHNERAVEFLERSIALDARSPFSHHQLGVALSALGRHEEALPNFAASSELDPKFGPAPLHAGHALLALGRPEAALGRFAASSAAEPDWVPPLLGAARSLAALGRKEEALDALERALALGPRQPAMLRDIATEFEGLGEKQRAAEVAALAPSRRR